MTLGVLGLGQAGGVIANQFYQRGIPAIAMNYSEKDLEALKTIPPERKKRLIGSEGVGKQRQKALDLMRDNWETAINFIKQHFSHPSIETIFVVFSSSGGSGSGIAPVLIDFMLGEMEGKNIVAVPIIPSDDEVIVNKMNAIATFEDLSDKEVAILPIDNQKVHVNSDNLGKSGFYKKINDLFINDITTIINYTEKSHVVGNLDKTDLSQIFSTPGIMIIGKTALSNIEENIQNVTKSAIATEIKTSWEESIYADIELDKVVRAGVIYEGQEELLPCVSNEEIFKPFVDVPLDLFEGYYVTETKGKLITILAGLSWPSTRLSKIEKAVKSKEEVMNQTLQRHMVFKSKIDRNSIADKLGRKKQKAQSTADIFNRYQR